MPGMKRAASTYSVNEFDGRSGYLEKRIVVKKCLGRSVVWKKKFFVLSGTTLSYYNEPDSQVIDVLDIQSDTTIDHEGHDGLTISISAAELWAIRASSRAEAQEWIISLKSACNPPLPSTAKKNSREAKTFMVAKGANNLGVSIAGGLGGAGVARKHIYVLDIHQGGVAAQSGLFEKGDIIIEVNGVTLEGCSHDDAVRILKESSGNVNFKVLRRRKLTPNPISEEQSSENLKLQSSPPPAPPQLHHNDNVDGSGIINSVPPISSPSTAPPTNTNPTNTATTNDVPVVEPTTPVKTTTTSSLTAGEDTLSPLPTSPTTNGSETPAESEAEKRAEMLRKMSKSRLDRRNSRQNDLLDALSIIDTLSED